MPVIINNVTNAPNTGWIEKAPKTKIPISDNIQMPCNISIISQAKL